MIKIRKKKKEVKAEVATTPPTRLTNTAVRMHTIRMAMNDLPPTLALLVRNSWDGEQVGLGLNPINIYKLDQKFSACDSSYNYEECTYRGKATSMRQYIEAKFGKAALETMNIVLGT